MPAKVGRSPTANRDLAEIAHHLAQQSAQAAHRFLDAFERTLADLAGMPEMGSPYESSAEELPALRFWPVRGFKNYLLFYSTSGQDLPAGCSRPPCRTGH
jgi:toxin ParE1/3/4